MVFQLNDEIDCSECGKKPEKDEFMILFPMPLVESKVCKEYIVLCKGCFRSDVFKQTEVIRKYKLEQRL